MERVKKKLMEIARETKRIAKEDPRRIVHSLKVGLCLALVSSFYYFQPFYESFGISAMWAVMTVAVVFEFSVGATLAKGLNRGAATLVAGALGIGAHHLANLSGQVGEPILLGIFVFIQAAISTFIRFFPKIKARYDYGLLIFILTFSLVSVSGFREDEILEFSHKRLSTVLIGGAACVVISIVVCPVWAGEDLHNLISDNLQKLANFLEGFGDEYFKTSDDGESEDGDKKLDLEAYKRVLNSKSTEESLANFARWEPRHGRFRFRHPWKQYLAVGALTRKCAYRIDGLNTYLNADVQASQEIKNTIEEPFKRTTSESSNALKELSAAVKTMTKPSSCDLNIKNSKSAAKSLNSLLNSELWKETDMLEVIPVATVASLLVDIVDCVEKISESVYELASMAHFKNEIESTSSPEKQPKDCKLKNVVIESPPGVTTDDDDDKEFGAINNLEKNPTHGTSTKLSSSSEEKCEDVKSGCPCNVVKVDGSGTMKPKNGNV